MPTYLFSSATKLFYNKLSKCIFTKNIYSGPFTLTHPKAFINKNLGYPPLLEWIVTGSCKGQIILVNFKIYSS